MTEEKINVCQHDFINFNFHNTGNRHNCRNCGVPEPLFNFKDIIKRTEWGHQELGVGQRAIVDQHVEWDYKRNVWRYKIRNFHTGKLLSGTWNEKYFEKVGAIATPMHEHSTFVRLMEFDKTINPNFRIELERIKKQINTSFYMSNLEMGTNAHQIIERILNQQKEPQMNEWVIKNYPKTEDAVLIQKYFSDKITSKWNQLLLKGKEEDLLALAKEQEAELAKKV